MAGHVADGCSSVFGYRHDRFDLVGVGVDFSIHIANRIKEMGGGIDAIREATVSTGMSRLKPLLSRH